MMNFKILLIEDCQKDAANILDQLNMQAEKRNTADRAFQFEFIKGTIEDQDNEYVFYDENIIDKIEEHLAGAGNEKIGLLLDVLLTKKDIENTLSSYYPQADLAKKIYFTFCDRIPVYMITGTATFSTQSDVIMGKDLSKQFIAKNALLRYKLENDIDRLFAFYQDYAAKIDSSGKTAAP